MDRSIVPPPAGLARFGPQRDPEVVSLHGGIYLPTRAGGRWNTLCMHGGGQALRSGFAPEGVGWGIEFLILISAPKNFARVRLKSFLVLGSPRQASQKPDPRTPRPRRPDGASPRPCARRLASALIARQAPHVGLGHGTELDYRPGAVFE